MRKTLAALLLVLSVATPAAAQVCPAVPSLPDTERRTQYSPSASTGPFNVGFAIYGDSTDFVDWVQVYVNGSLLDSTAYTLTSATGSLAQICRPITNAQVTLTAAATGTVQIVGARRPRRTSQFAENRGVTARDLNQLNTDIIAMAREAWDLRARTIQGQPGDVFAALPPAATRAGQVIGFDGSGGLTLVTPPSSTTINVPATVCTNQFVRSIAIGGAATCQSIAAADLPANLGNITTGTILGGGGQTLTVSPTGNPPSTLASISVQGNAASTTTREFMANFGMVNTVIGGVHGTGVDKVALYAGITNVAGTPINQDQWAFNTVTTMEAGTGNVYNTQGYELDFNNLNAHHGDADGGSGLAAPIAYGLNITGASTFRSSAAQLISGSGSVVNTDGVTNATTTFTSATANFQVSDVGRSIIIAGSGAAGARLVATIASRTNATTVVLSAAASDTASSKTFWLGAANWNRGIVVANNSVQQASFQDLGAAEKSIDIRGTHVYGIDLSTQSSFAKAAIRLANNSPIQMNDTGGTGYNVAYMNTTDNFELGGGKNIIVRPAGSAAPAAFFFNLHATAGDVGVTVGAGTNTNADTTSALMTFAWPDNSTTVGSITRAAANTVSYNTSSDARLKNVVGAARGCIDQIGRVKVRDFTWKSDTSRKVYRGYIAQELNGVFPQAVHVGADDPTKDPWGVDYGKMTPLETCAIQELKAENDNLRARLDRIERRTRRGG